MVLGGSQGSERINETILTILDQAVKKYQIIHQVGKNNLADVSGRAGVILAGSEFKTRYHSYGFLDEGELRDASRVAFLIVSRSSSAIFEIAAWGVPAILIPLATAAQNHQRENAYAYAGFGGCQVIEETNLTPHLLLAEIDKILGDPARQSKMKLAAQGFARLDAAEKIAKEIIKLGVHE
ncbi:MAG: UDP diphospho-muramoyl pentapeptide beta-N acetylglucosaminyl transferase [Candidatus Giovannonibacteria bacterium GW2011_GWC2_43_8]|nr:MAG: UDP diphospho-muramoyl pentapeptide beta-N acetylglucosaminyl transferase [Candidatus Giovannonibacteria bacterium GW2011_GWC2_43_8]